MKPDYFIKEKYNLWSFLRNHSVFIEKDESCNTYKIRPQKSLEYTEHAIAESTKENSIGFKQLKIFFSIWFSDITISGFISKAVYPRVNPKEKKQTTSGSLSEKQLKFCNLYLNYCPNSNFLNCETLVP